MKTKIPKTPFLAAFSVGAVLFSAQDVYKRQIQGPLAFPIPGDIFCRGWLLLVVLYRLAGKCLGRL